MKQWVFQCYTVMTSYNVNEWCRIMTIIQLMLTHAENKQMLNVKIIKILANLLVSDLHSVRSTVMGLTTDTFPAIDDS